MDISLTFTYTSIVTCPFIPVSSNFYVKSHLDIQQVLVLPKVTGHLTLSAPQLILQLPN